MAGIATLKDNVHLYIGESSALTTTDKIGNVYSIGEVGGEKEEIDVTTIDSQAKEYVPGFADNGSVQIAQNITKDEFAKVKQWVTSGTMLHCGIAFTDASECNMKFKGFIKSYKLGGMEVGGVLRVTYDIRVSGEIEDFTEPSGGTV